MKKITISFETESEKISEYIEIDEKAPLSTQLLNYFVHQELFLEKAGYESEISHRTYLKLLEAFGILKKYDYYKENPNEEIFKDFNIETLDKFISQVSTDRSFASFIYDILKEKL